jgi:hypothetical protein
MFEQKLTVELVHRANPYLSAILLECCNEAQQLAIVSTICNGIQVREAIPELYNYYYLTPLIQTVVQ